MAGVKLPHTVSYTANDPSSIPALGDWHIQNLDHDHDFDPDSWPSPWPKKMTKTVTTMTMVEKGVPNLDVMAVLHPCDVSEVDILKIIYGLY